MDSLRRLLELAGLLVEDLPPARDELSRERALSILARAGAFVSTTSTADELKTAWIKLQRMYHEGGSEPDPERLKWINRAYQTLKTEAPTTQAPPAPSEDARDYTVWGWDGRLFIPGYQVSATPEQFPEIARTALQKLRQGFKVPRGIVLQTKREVLLIYFNGRDVDPPEDYACYGNPSRDTNVINWLKAR